MKTAVIIHYNTPELTEATIRSLNKFSPGFHVVVLDNSDRRPFINSFDNVEVWYNMEHELIDFEYALNQFKHRVKSKNKWASVKHTISVQFVIDRLDCPFVLLDSDVLIKRDISDLFDESRAFVGEIQRKLFRFVLFKRLKPMLCFINAPFIKKYDIKYFDKYKTWKLHGKFPENHYDTGGFFLEECLRLSLPYKEICLDDYILHFGGASYKELDWSNWLNDNVRLYD